MRGGGHVVAVRHHFHLDVLRLQVMDEGGDVRVCLRRGKEGLKLRLLMFGHFEKREDASFKQLYFKPPRSFTAPPSSKPEPWWPVHPN